MYAMVCTRPDIAFAVGYLSRFISNPTTQHFNMTKQIAKYIKGTSNLSLEFRSAPGPLKLSSYCDSD